MKVTEESRTHSIPGCIVSLAQLWVRSIVRGKIHANKEFGVKLHISLVDGYARIEWLDFEAYNESADFRKAVYHYHDRNAMEGTFSTSKTSYGLDRISVSA